MKNKLITTSLLIAAVLILLGVIITGSQDKKVNNSVIFFYGNTCPHCAEVEKWMEENKVADKIKVDKKEVYENSQNALELTEVARSCGLPTDNIGVPFLYADGKCFIGTPNVEAYLGAKK